MYKHPRHSEKNSPCRSGTQGRQSVNDTPKVNLGVGFNQNPNRTAMSGFGMMSRPPVFIDIRKAEQINLNMHHVVRSTKPIDSIVTQLQMIKTVLKAAKVSLFIIEQEMIDRIFTFQKDRKHNYRKILVGTNTVLTVFNSEEDFQQPLFKGTDQITQVFNAKTILLPMWDALGSKIP
jgi:hypothetical protein